MIIIFDLDGTLWDTIKATYQATINVTSNINDINKISKNTVKTGMGLSFDENAEHYMPNLEKKKREEILNQINNETMKLLKAGKTKFWNKKNYKKIKSKISFGNCY